MKKSIFLITLIIGLIFGFTYSKNETFQTGESYGYSIRYGIINIGRADIGVDEKIVNINGNPTYKVNVLGRTSGLTDIFKVRNRYTSYIDTRNYLPQKFEYSARENNYKRDQVLIFDHSRNTVTKREKGESETYKVPRNIHDVISGYYSLRNIDFSQFNIGQTYSAPLFFDDEYYQFIVKYGGKSQVKTPKGKIDVLKLNPILPNNRLFKGENAIRVWVSDDKNRVPVRIEVDFSFGTIHMVLRDYSKNMYPFDWK